ncbi:serine/threonine-protein kinase Chk1-like [Oratosquilla oratoria]|uniref:serine/threonine-protein kinase Chk1-like n=1 Tax=Oratosquilla oratoria TaxID=337810 RepID=UPI003F75EEAE
MAFLNLCFERLRVWISRRGKKHRDNKGNKQGSSNERTDHEVFKYLVTESRRRKVCRKNIKKAETYLHSSDWCKVRLLGRGSFDDLREEYVHCQIQHSNVVQLICFQRTLTKVVLCLEYCAGGTVSDVIGYINEEEALRLFGQLMEAVEHLHSRGIVHRDLKPDNLLLTEEKVLKVADLGLAAIYVVKNKEVLLKGYVGTRAYMAPEVIESSKYLGPPVDLWSCGVTLFTIINGDEPWESPDLDNRFYNIWVNQDDIINDFKVWNRLSESFQEILRALIAVDPSQRLIRWRTLRALPTG